MKALFITHDTGNYGASTSLQLLLNNYTAAEYDLVIPRRIIGRYDKERIRSRFGGRAGTIEEYFLPFDFSFRYKPEGSLRRFTMGMYRNRIAWPCDRGRLRAFIRKGRYDYVHLNSLVLHEVVDSRNNFFIHVRDIYDGTNPGVHESLKKACGVIFIDEATREPFAHTRLRNSIVLNNPFDMTHLRNYRGEGIDRAHSDLVNRTVFSLIGRVTEKKGAEFVIRCFSEVPGSDARLLIVGDGDRNYLGKCRSLAGNDPRIIFWGEEDDMRKVYYLSDYILRGEDFQCIGRTIYEGLYSGCGVIIPSVANDGRYIFQYEQFKDSVFLYPPRDSGSLKAILGKLMNRKIAERHFRSNIREYVQSFQGFVASAHPAWRDPAG